MKDQIPGQAKKLQKEGEEGLQSAKSHLSALGNDIKAEGRKAEAKLNAAASDAHVQATKAVDAFDKNVNEVSEREDDDRGGRNGHGQVDAPAEGDGTNTNSSFCRAGGIGHRWAGGDEEGSGVG